MNIERKCNHDTGFPFKYILDLSLIDAWEILLLFDFLETTNLLLCVQNKCPL